MATPALFTPLTLRGITIPNRIAVSPMCQYSCDDGFATDWHLVHLGSRAIGGAGLIIAEATAVEARGRISPGDLGLWKDEHIAPLARIARFIKDHGAVPGIQIAHAGRKASCERPWDGGAQIHDARGWTCVAPSAIPFNPADPPPHELSVEEIGELTRAFVRTTERALEAGFEVIEIHGAHGYLIHEFCSPLSNRRTDAYGGSFANRIRFALEVTRAVRATWPQHLPLLYRVSAQDWVEDGWQLADSVELAKSVKELGVDLIDVSSGGAVPHARVQAGPGYQVPFASEIRRGAGIATGAVGLITEAHQAEAILQEGHSDLVLLARQMLRDPYFALHAARELNYKAPVPVQYGRAL